jgi:uncharacterized protein (TIGR00251 family)
VITLLTVRVQPGAKKSRVVGKLGDLWKIAIRAPPVDGKANATLLEFLSEVLDLPRSAVNIKRGSTGRTKTIAIDGRDSNSIEEALSRYSQGIARETG